MDYEAIAKRIEVATRGSDALLSSDELTDQMTADTKWLKDRYSELKQTKEPKYGLKYDFSAAAKIARQELIAKILREEILDDDRDSLGMCS